MERTWGKVDGSANLHLLAGQTLPVWFVLTVFTGVSVTWFLNKYLLQPYLIYLNLKKQGVKGASFRPFIGQLPEAREHMKRKQTDPEYAKTMFLQSQEVISKYGETHTSQWGPSVDLVFTSPTAIKEVLVTKADCFEKPAYLKKMLAVMGNGLLFAEGGLWKRQRKMIDPAFNHKEIKAMSTIMVQCANEAVDRWAQSVKQGTQELDMLLEFSRLTLDVVGRAAMGSDDAASEAAANKVYTGLGKMIEDKVVRMMSGWDFIPGYNFLPTSTNRTIWRQEADLRAMGLQLIKRRREAKEEGFEKRDLLGMMLAAQDEHTDAVMTDDQLLGECMTFLLAGHETTAVLLTWTTYLLTQHPEYLDRARKEVLEVLAGRDEVAYEDLHRFKLLQCILYETLRLFPPVPMMARIVTRETEVAGIRLQKGTDVTLINYPMHVRESLWGEDAKQFRPERFFNGISGAVKQPNAFLPFSAGPRTCIGQNFAMTEAKIILAKLLRRFSFKLAPGYQHFPVMYITLKPGRGLPVILEPLS